MSERLRHLVDAANIREEWGEKLKSGEQIVVGLHKSQVGFTPWLWSFEDELLTRLRERLMRESGESYRSVVSKILPVGYWIWRAIPGDHGLCIDDEAISELLTVVARASGPTDLGLAVKTRRFEELSKKYKSQLAADFGPDDYIIVVSTALVGR